MTVPGGTIFELPLYALTHPADVPWGEAVTLTMVVDKVTRNGKEELVFTFGPHGSVFDPPASVTFDWSDLGIDLADLYYIDDNGNYVPQSPDQIDVKNKRMTLTLHHFSRYAIAHSR